MNASKRVLIMAGGTGGHIFPALAVARVLRARDQQVFWLGARGGLEADLVPRQGFPLHLIAVSGLRGKRRMTQMLAPFHLLRALWQADRVVRQTRPAVVLGFGGFASGPGGLAARLRGIGLVVHEQNAIAGTTNRLLGRFAGRTLQAFPDALQGAELVGNPVRAEIEQIPAPEQRMAGRTGPICVLVLGGSQGARALNRLVPEALAAAGVPVAVRHQCGLRWLEETQRAYHQFRGHQARGHQSRGHQSRGQEPCDQESHLTVRVEPFIDDMAEAYSWADLVICRAGAMTVSELAAAGLASVLIPFPHAIDNHQHANARWLAGAGAAVLMPESELTSVMLAEQLAGLMQRDQLQGMAQAARGLARPQTAERIADICLEVAGE